MKTSPLTRVVLLAVCGAMSLANTASAVPMVSDPNLLSGLANNTANIGISTYDNDGGSPSIYGPGGADYGPQNVTNGTGAGAGADFVFASGGDSDQRLAVTGFNSALSDIRIWTGNLRPTQVTVLSSTSSETSITASSYPTTLVHTMSLGASNWSDHTAGDINEGLAYVDFKVSAPVGTQTLFFDFGSGNDLSIGTPGFARIAEVQAFPTPEPGSFVLCGLGAISLCVAARRHRNA